VGGDAACVAQHYSQMQEIPGEECGITLRESIAESDPRSVVAVILLSEEFRAARPLAAPYAIAPVSVLGCS
jgi:hypothetical protein